MENYCTFSKNHKCLNWTDYELTRYELEDARQTGLKLNKKMNTYNYYRHYLTITVSHIQSNNNVLTLKGSGFRQTLIFAPQVCPS